MKSSAVGMVVAALAAPMSAVGGPTARDYLPGSGQLAERPLFSFGVITDVQYADIPDGKSFAGVPRFYRHSLEVLQRAVRSWNAAGDLSFAVHFGDIVDGFCPKEKSLEAVKRVLGNFQEFKGGPVYHMLGNHCLYNLPRPQLNELLSIPESPEGASYYAFCPHPGFLFVVLDGYDVSMLGWPPDHPHTRAAERLLAAHNPNEDKNNPTGLEGPVRRFVKFGGGVSERQLAWLDGELRAAAGRGDRVLVGCHMPLEPATLPVGTCLLWNYPEVLEVLHRYECVVACFAGHAHSGGYALDAKGIHHRVLEAALECPPGTDAFGRVDVYAAKMCLRGEGRMSSTCMEFSPRQCRL